MRTLAMLLFKRLSAYILSASLLTFLFTATAHSQWVQTNGPYVGYVYSLAVSPAPAGNLFAGTIGGVFLSTNNGTSWTAANTGLANTDVGPLAVSGTNLFAGTSRGVFLSTNNGTSWTAASTGLTNTNILSLAVSPAPAGNLFAGTLGGGVFLSTNNGTSWTAASSGLTNTAIEVLVVSGTNLFAGTYGGVFRSTNNGTSWTAANTGLTNTSVFTLAVSGTNLFAGTEGGGVFLSTNNGTSWAVAGLPNTFVRSFAVNGTNLFAGTDGWGVFLSTNNGTSWTAANTGLTNAKVSSLAVSGTNLFVGIIGSGVWRRPLAEMITSVDRMPTDLPTQFSLSQNYPNPFNPSTRISFNLPLQSVVLLNVFDALGREVAILVSEELSAGTYSIQWDAGSLPGGVYFYRMQAGSFTETKKLILLR